MRIQQLVFVPLILLAASAGDASAQTCPTGLSCFYVPPLMMIPMSATNGYSGDIVFASPTVNATVTYAFGTQSPTTIVVNAGTATIVSIPLSYGSVSAFRTAERRGLFVTSTASDLVVEQRYTAQLWQSSSTIKPHTTGLGTHFRVAGYSLNGANDGSGFDYIAVYAPTDTTVTATAPSALWNGVSGSVATFNLTAGQTYVLRTNSGVDIDGTSVDSTAPISLVVGGRGWGGNAGDQGDDAVVPTVYNGTQFVVTSWSGAALQDVRIVADVANTVVKVNGAQMTTLAAGGVYKFTPSGVTFIETTQPVSVFQNATLEAGASENDIVFVPPVAFANVASLALTINVLSNATGSAFIVIPTAAASTLRIDGNAVSVASSTTVPGHPEWTAIRTNNLAAGTHRITGTGDFQVSLCASGGGTGLFSANSPFRRPGCGDGALQTDETCDDGNLNSGDGCSTVCTTETGYSCTGAPSVCSCANDSACQAGTYCTSATSPPSCVMALRSGTAIPADHGECEVSIGSFGTPTGACASGRCSPTVNMCGSVPGTPCTTDSQCASYICHTDGKCGLPTGTSGCSAARDCRSGVCSSGTCIPAATGACAVDGDCALSQFCNYSTLTCTAKLAEGSPIVADGLHTASCASADAVCESGLCNAQTVTCGLFNGLACNTANKCVSNICGSNGLCGIANGQSGCTSVNEQALCQSGECSANAGICVPTSTSCWTDNDCGNNASQFCKRDTFACVDKLENGSAIPSDTLHNGTCTDGNATATCASGKCNTTTNSCAGPNTTTSCDNANDCVSNLCGSNGSCGLANGDSGCTSLNQATTCQSGSCSPNAGVCVPSGGCYVDPDCSSDKFCNQSSYACTLRLAAGAPLPGDGLHDACSSGTNSACASGLCNATTLTCAGSNGSSCSAANECAGNFCGSNDLCGRANGQSGCSVNGDCQSGACVSSVCVPPGGCALDDNCTSGQYCDRVHFTCAGDLANGQAIPSDGLHGGTCSDAAAVCQSGLCNSVTNTCAVANGAACGAANQCVTNACGSNSQCGLVAGQTGCTGPTDAICQSSTCSIGGACISPTNGCYVDGDCDSSSYCDRTHLECVAKRHPGAPIPNDGLHDGTCTSAAAVCASPAACNSSTNTCAASNGTSCSADNECVANVCGTNDRCGLANHQGSCNTGNAGALCQSGLCSMGSVCVAAATCYVDNDCSSSQYCDRANFVCTSKHGNGESIPSDALHDGTCNAAAATCVSGECNSTTHTCATINGQSCSAANQCTSNACGSDGQCGLANGDSGCDSGNAATVCRSGVCVSGACVPTGGCFLDSDCATGQFCHRSTFACVAKLTAGEAIPNDGYHDGSCGAASATCASGQCNPTTNTCALAHGNACSANNQCTLNVCGANHQCGLAEGQSGCTTSSAAVCQTGLCNPSGVCVTPSSCYADKDCGTDGWCNASTYACATKLPAASKIPDEPLHGGKCTPENAATICASGLCNSDTGTCANDNGSSCEDNSACASNTCSTDGQCGIAVGEMCANNDECRSGSCDQGICAPKALDFTFKRRFSCSNAGTVDGAWTLCLALAWRLTRSRRRLT